MGGRREEASLVQLLGASYGSLDWALLEMWEAQMSPWWLDHSGNLAGHCRPIIKSKKRIIADCPPAYKASLSEVEADFRLIAEAPEMFSLLKTMARYYRDSIPASAIEEGVEPEVQFMLLAEAAIARATGGTP